MIRQGARFGFAIVLAGVVAYAASRAREPGKYRADANLVLVGATVVDGHSRVVRGLTQSDFRLFEDAAEQKIVSFSEEDLPVSIAIVFDISGSMANKLPGTRGALGALLQTSNPEDEYCLISFGERPEIAVPWTGSDGEILSRVLSTRSNGRTALLDAVALGIEQLHRSHNARRALVIFSDGGDNYSRITENHLFRVLEETDVRVYAVDMRPWVDPALERAPEEIAGPNLLTELCDRAGGRYFAPEGRPDIEKVADRIGKELRSQYVLGYSPARLTNDGKLHRVQLKVVSQGGGHKLSVYARRGYRAPAE
jgi:Ca-activated chloride channel family protein